MRPWLGYMAFTFLALSSPYCHGALPGNPGGETLWDSLPDFEATPGSDPDLLARQKARWDFVMAAPVAEDRPQTAFQPKLYGILRTAKHTGGLSDDFETRWRLSAQNPGAFRSQVSFTRRLGEKEIPQHVKWALAADRLAPAFALVLGALDLRLGSGLVFQTQPLFPASRTWQGNPQEVSSRVDMDPSWSLNNCPGLALKGSQGPWSAGLFWVSMPWDARVSEGTPLRPFPHVPTRYLDPLLRNDGADKDLQGALDQWALGAYGGWHRRGLVLDLNAVYARRSLPYLPTGDDSDLPGYQGTEAITSSFGISAGDQEGGLQMTGAANLHPQAPRPGSAGEGPFTFDPCIQGRFFFTVGSFQYQLGGEGRSAGFAPILAEGMKDDPHHGARARLYLQARSTRDLEPLWQTACRWGLWLRTSSDPAEGTGAMIHGAAAFTRGPLRFMGELSSAIPLGPEPGQQQGKLALIWQGQAWGLRLQGQVTLTNLDMGASASLQALVRPHPALECRLSLGATRANPSVVWDAGDQGEYLAATPQANYQASLRLKFQPSMNFALETALRATSSQSLVRWALSSSFVLGPHTDPSRE